MNLSPEHDGREHLILALDFASAATALPFLAELRSRTERPPKWLKLGLELFLAEGASLVDRLHEQGYSLFLDLKLHDIPNTVAAAIRVLGSLEVELLTVHAAGGPAMLEAAAEAAAALRRTPLLLAVTVLTSIDGTQLRAIGVDGSPQQQVLRLAQLAARAGISGVVASPLEAAMLRGKMGAGLHLVTPGIRPEVRLSEAAASVDDQQRVATPDWALRAGASQLVVGRPVTRAVDPAYAYHAILDEIEAAFLVR